MMIHEAQIEFCIIVEYANGDKFCVAKFMHEDDVRRYRRSRKKKEYSEWKLYKRTAKYSGEVRWESLE